MFRKEKLFKVFLLFRDLEHEESPGIEVVVGVLDSLAAARLLLEVVGLVALYLFNLTLRMPEKVFSERI